MQYVIILVATVIIVKPFTQNGQTIHKLQLAVRSAKELLRLLLAVSNVEQFALHPARLPMLQDIRGENASYGMAGC
eukprot:1605964-Amphidinium_carterae.1